MPFSKWEREQLNSKPEALSEIFPKILLAGPERRMQDMEILPPKQGEWARSPVCGSPVSVLDPDCPAVHQAPVKVFGKPCISYMVGSDAWP